VAGVADSGDVDDRREFARLRVEAPQGAALGRRRVLAVVHRELRVGVAGEIHVQVVVVAVEGDLAARDHVGLAALDEDGRRVEPARVATAGPVPGRGRRGGADLRTPAELVDLLGLAGGDQAAVAPEGKAGLAALARVNDAVAGVDGPPVVAVLRRQP